MSAFFFKKSVFLAKIVPLHKAIVWKLWLRIFSAVFSFSKIKGYYHLKFKFCRLCVQNPALGFLQLVVNWKNCCDVTNSLHDIIVNFFYATLFLLSSLLTGPSFMSTSSLVLELWQFSFIWDWPKILKLEIPPSEFYPISADWIPNLVQMSLIKCYWILQNARVTAFTVSELLRENQQRYKILPPPTPCPD